jgi:sn-glycerol 3-phosphate transport system permease protein
MNAERPADLSGRLVAAALWACVALALLPLYLVLSTASVSYDQLLEGLPWTPGTSLPDNLAWVWNHTPIPRQMLNSLVIAGTVSVVGTSLAFLTACAIVFFGSRLAPVLFALVLATQMLPLEVRIVPTYGVVSDIAGPLRRLFEWLGSDLLAGVQINLLDSYAGMILPLLSSATAIFMLRQALLSLPPALTDAARMDGAGPLRFMFQIALPAVRPTLAAAAVLSFVGSWNHYIWPLMANSRSDLLPASVGIASMNAGVELGELPLYHYQMTAALLVVLPPLLVVAMSKRWLTQRASMAER